MQTALDRPREQGIWDPKADVSQAAERIRNEYVLQVKGRVRLRPEGTVNPDMATGQVDVVMGRDYEDVFTYRFPLAGAD